MSALRREQNLAVAIRALAVCQVRTSGLGDRGNNFSGHTDAADGLVPRDVVDDQPKEWHQRAGLQRVLGLGSYQTAWVCLHKLRRAMVRPGRERLSGSVEVDETYLGGLEEGLRGRQTESKALIVVAAEEDGKRIGRIRMRRIPDASARSLVSFVEESVEPGSVVHTDGWLGYEPLETSGYTHKITFLRGHQKSPSELLPRVHRVVSLLKRWLLGTHQGAVSIAHLDGYLDEFTFRFNRRKSQSRGKLFFRLVQQAVAVEPATYKAIVRSAQADWT
jgi:transposase-like protein